LLVKQKWYLSQKLIGIFDMTEIKIGQRWKSKSNRTIYTIMSYDEEDGLWELAVGHLRFRYTPVYCTSEEIHRTLTYIPKIYRNL
jgi:hypothetical protein